jgi:hypothetical protein
VPIRLVANGSLERAERVDVLDLAARAELSSNRGRTETLASTRIEPSSILASLTPIASTILRSSST